MSLHNDIMNIQVVGNKSGLYKRGHKDARHAAAELSLKYERALEMAMFCLEDMSAYPRSSAESCMDSANTYRKKIQQILEEE